MTNTQQVRLWLSNEECMYREALRRVNRHANLYDAATDLQHWVEGECLMACRSGTLASDLLQSALQDVHWDQVAESFLPEEPDDPIDQESEVVSNLVRKLTDDGCLLEVAQEGEVPEDPMSDIHSVVLAQLMHCDTDYLYVYDGDKQPLGFIRLIYGQSEESPMEVISDYTASDYINGVIRHIDN